MTPHVGQQDAHGLLTPIHGLLGQVVCGGAAMTGGRKGCAERSARRAVMRGAPAVLAKPCPGRRTIIDKTLGCDHTACSGSECVAVSLSLLRGPFAAKRTCSLMH